jgi:hypothetical protein
VARFYRDKPIEEDIAAMLLVDHRSPVIDALTASSTASSSMDMHPAPAPGSKRYSSDERQQTPTQTSLETQKRDACMKTTSMHVSADTADIIRKTGVEIECDMAQALRACRQWGERQTTQNTTSKDVEPDPDHGHHDDVLYSHERRRSSLSPSVSIDTDHTVAFPVAGPISATTVATALEAAFHIWTKKSNAYSKLADECRDGTDEATADSMRRSKTVPFETHTYRYRLYNVTAGAS